MAKAKTKTKRATSKPKPRTKRTRKSKTTAAAAAETKPEEEKEKSVVLRVEPIPEEEQENPSISRETFYATRTGKPLRGGQEQRRPFYFRETPYGLIFLFLGGTAALAYFIYQMYLDGRLPGFTPKPTTSTPRGGLFSEGGPDAWTYVVIGLVVLLVGATLEITGIGRRIAESLAGLFLSRGKGKDDEDEGGNDDNEDDEDDEEDESGGEGDKKRFLSFGAPFRARYALGSSGDWTTGFLKYVQLGGEEHLVQVDNNRVVSDLERLHKETEELREELRAKKPTNRLEVAHYKNRIKDLERQIDEKFEELKKEEIDWHEPLER